MAVTMVGLVVMATPAWAHHPVISGTAQCGTERGTVEIDYMATPWTTDPANGWGRYISESDLDGVPTYDADNDPSTPPVQYTGHVELEYAEAGGSYVSVRDDIEFTPSITSVNGSFQVPDTASFPLTLHVVAVGQWKNGVDGASTNPETLYEVAAPTTDCSPDIVAPVASSSWECGDETIAVTLDNSASTVSVVFDVNGTEYTVDAGETQVVDLGGPGRGR